MYKPPITPITPITPIAPIAQKKARPLLTSSRAKD